LQEIFELPSRRYLDYLNQSRLTGHVNTFQPTKTFDIESNINTRNCNNSIRPLFLEFGVVTCSPLLLSKTADLVRFRGGLDFQLEVGRPESPLGKSGHFESEVMLKAFALLPILLCTSFAHNFGLDLEYSITCKFCGKEIAKTSDRAGYEFAGYSRYGMIIVPTQKLRNPQGSVFELITVQHASLVSEKQSYTQASWFDGYSWRISGCRSCKRHLGWTFDPITQHTDSFQGLIIDRLFFPQHSGFASI